MPGLPGIPGKSPEYYSGVRFFKKIPKKPDKKTGFLYKNSLQKTGCSGIMFHHIPARKIPASDPFIFRHANHSVMAGDG